MSTTSLATSTLGRIRWDPQDSALQKDVLVLIMQWLEEHKYTTALWTLREEGGFLDREAEHRRKHVSTMVAAIQEGNWDTITSLSSKNTFKANKAFQYALARQQYLEIVASRDSQKALAFIVRRLKPLEQYATEKEFYALAYLLTCRSVHDAPLFRSWDEASGRQRIIDEFHDVLNLDDVPPRGVNQCNAGRLEQLLRQACAFQVLSQIPLPAPTTTTNLSLNSASSNFLMTPQGSPLNEIEIESLLQNYCSRAVPNCVRRTWQHSSKARAVTFCGARDEWLVSSGSHDIAAWRISESSETVTAHTFPTSEGKVWALDGSRGNHSPYLFAGACCDGIIRLWDLQSMKLVQSTAAHVGDAYSCAFSPRNWVLSGGYDRMTSIIDVATGTVIRTFGGHTSTVTCVASNNVGTVVASASKDGTIKFFDVASGVCVQTLSDPVAGVPISSVAFSPDGATLAASAMNNTVRLWDLGRSKLHPQRLKGHSNIQRNFIGVTYGASSDTVYSGSEDGRVHVWKSDGTVLGVLPHDGDAVFSVRWSTHHNVLATCTATGWLRLWSPDDGAASQAAVIQKQ